MTCQGERNPKETNMGMGSILLSSSIELMRRESKRETERWENGESTTCWSWITKCPDSGIPRKGRLTPLNRIKRRGAYDEEEEEEEELKDEQWEEGMTSFFLFFQISNYLEAQLSCRSSLAMQVLSRWILDLGTLIGDSSCEILTLATGTGTETVYLSLLAWEMTWWWVVPVHYCLVRVVAAFFIFFFLQY